MSAPRVPPPPGLLSTITGWPRRLPRGPDMARATMSAPPPGANGTTRRIGRLGYSCALAPRASAAIMRARKVLIMVCRSVEVDVAGLGERGPTLDFVVEKTLELALCPQRRLHAQLHELGA